jgi:CBS domain-containing protein
MSVQDSIMTPSVANMAATYGQIATTIFAARTFALATKTDKDVLIIMDDPIINVRPKDRLTDKVSKMLDRIFKVSKMLDRIFNNTIPALPVECRAQVQTLLGEIYQLHHQQIHKRIMQTVIQ